MKNEYGRSMIEMLGVLAIIGVLSIGGLAGYTMAMNRHRANQILDYVSRCAVAAQTKGDGYFIGQYTYSMDAQGNKTYTVTNTTCSELLPLEAAPNALIASQFTVYSSGAGDFSFTVETPVINSTDIRTALLNRDNINVTVSQKTAGTNPTSVYFTFRK